MKDDLLNMGLGAGPKIDPKEFPNKKCDHCGYEVFTKGYIFKEIPGTLVGNGSEPIEYPITVLICQKCGKVLSSDVKTFGINIDNEQKQEEKKSSILL